MDVKALGIDTSALCQFNMYNSYMKNRHIKYRIKYKIINSYYWVKWFIFSRGGRRKTVGRRRWGFPLYDIPMNPTIRLGGIKTRRFHLIDRDQIKEKI